jgi:two-component system phosphate regulon sensor histidine kinase PhoR
MTLRKKIALLLTLSVLVVGCAVWCVIYRAERRELIEDNSEVLSRYLDVFVKTGEQQGVGGMRNIFYLWNKVYPEGRITLINNTGEVIFDSKSDPSEMDNHYKRPEVMKAFSEGEGSELRYSKTQNEWQHYMAKRVTVRGKPDVNMVVRMSYPLDELKGLAWSKGRPFIYALAVILLLVWIIAYMSIRVIMRPLNSLSKAACVIESGGTARFPITNDAEMQSLSNALNSMSDSLKLSVKEAQERKEELALLVGALPIGVILIDANKKIRYINEAASILCGKNGNIPARGTSVEIVLPSEEMCRILDMPDGKKLLTLQRNGGVKLEITTLAVTRGRLIVIQDFTEKMRLEESQREFFIDVGHEFQTPLTIIRTGLEMLKSGGSLPNKDDIDAVNSMIRQQERLSCLVDDLLFLMRLDVNALKTDVDDIDLIEMGKEIISELRELPISREIEIEEVFSCPSAVVRGRYEDLRRALFNILENGVKYVSSYHGQGGRLRFSVEESGDKWKLTVDDNGPGIPDGERNIIFERFRRGDSHRARKTSSPGGYGLGLSISRRIAERHGGRLELTDSKLGGAAFVMILPKARG